jgi:hypothetical protein
MPPEKVCQDERGLTARVGGTVTVDRKVQRLGNVREQLLHIPRPEGKLDVSDGHGIRFHDAVRIRDRSMRIRLACCDRDENAQQRS